MKKVTVILPNLSQLDAPYRIDVETNPGSTAFMPDIHGLNDFTKIKLISIESGIVNILT